MSTRSTPSTTAILKNAWQKNAWRTSSQPRRLVLSRVHPVNLPPASSPASTQSYKMEPWSILQKGMRPLVMHPSTLQPYITAPPSTAPISRNMHSMIRPMTTTLLIIGLRSAEQSILDNSILAKQQRNNRSPGPWELCQQQQRNNHHYHERPRHRQSRCQQPADHGYSDQQGSCHTLTQAPWIWRHDYEQRVWKGVVKVSLGALSPNGRRSDVARGWGIPGGTYPIELVKTTMRRVIIGPTKVQLTAVLWSNLM